MNSSWVSVLIRSINNKEIGFIEGPCRVVNQILSLYNKSSILELVGKDAISALDNKINFKIVDGTSSLKSKESIYCGVRIGLSDKYPQYQHQKLRYLIGPHLIKKKNGILEKYKLKQMRNNLADI